MRTLLINPGKEHMGNLDARAAAPPLGLLYIASNLVKHGEEVGVIDQAGASISDNQLISQVKQYEPDLVGFSTMGIQSRSAGRIADKLKKELPNTKIVCGGIGPTFSANYILDKYPAIDYCIKGEGELSTIELIKALKNKAFDKVHGLVYRAGKRLKEGLPRKLIEDLDSLPFPDRDLVKSIKYGELSGLKVEGFTSILSSRGCPHACKYCCCNALVKRRWRARNINSVLDELELIQDQGYKNVLFFDDGLTINNKRLLKMCDGIKERGLKLNWFFEGRVDNAEQEVLRQMARAGAKVCYFGAESANQHVLDYYKKGITPQQTISAVNKARKAGIDFLVASFILGAPNETKADIERTIKFMTKLDVDFVQVTNLIAYPGTELWDDFVAKGYLDPSKYWETGVGAGEVYPGAVPHEYVISQVKDAYARFVNNTKLRIRHIWRVIKSGFRRQILMQNLKYFDKDIVKRLIGRKN